MIVLFITDHNVHKNINQVIMIVPDQYSPAIARANARECGIEHPNIRILGQIADEEIRKTRVDEYAPYSR